MLIVEDIERQGRWLFRWRGYLPVLILAVSALAIATSAAQRQDSMRWDVACLLVSSIGLLIRAITIGHTPAGTSGRTAKRQIAQALNTTGMYSLVRHPLYLGNFFLMLGVVLFAGSLWLTLLYVPSFWLYYERIMAAEEAFLEASFGAALAAWSVATPAFIPRFSGWVRPALGFSLKNVLRREYNGFFAIFASMFLLDVTRQWVAFGRLQADARWIALLGAAMLVWATLRSLKRYTSLLRVKGR